VNVKHLLLIILVLANAAHGLDERDLERGYGRMRWGVCNKAPLDGPGEEDKGLRLEDFRSAPIFLKTLSNYVYSFDKEYLLALAEITSGLPDQADLLAIFVLNASAPYVGGLQYLAVKERYLDVAMDNLKCLNKNFGIESLSAMKDIQIFQEAAVKFLMKSLASARPMLSERQKELSSSLVAFFGDALAEGINEATLARVRSRLPELMKMEQELAENVFLRSRAAGDILVARYLEEQ